MFHIDWQAWQANEKILLSTSQATTKPCWNPDSKGFTMQRSKLEGSVEVASAALVGSPPPGDVQPGSFSRAHRGRMVTGETVTKCTQSDAKDLDGFGYSLLVGQQTYQKTAICQTNRLIPSRHRVPIPAGDFWMVKFPLPVDHFGLACQISNFTKKQGGQISNLTLYQLTKLTPTKCWFWKCWPSSQNEDGLNITPGKRKMIFQF